MDIAKNSGGFSEFCIRASIRMFEKCIPGTENEINKSLNNVVCCCLVVPIITFALVFFIVIFTVPISLVIIGFSPQCAVFGHTHHHCNLLWLVGIIWIGLDIALVILCCCGCFTSILLFWVRNVRNKKKDKKEVKYKSIVNEEREYDEDEDSEEGSSDKDR